MNRLFGSNSEWFFACRENNKIFWTNQVTGVGNNGAWRNQLFVAAVLAAKVITLKSIAIFEILLIFHRADQRGTYRTFCPNSTWVDSACFGPTRGQTGLIWGPSAYMRAVWADQRGLWATSMLLRCDIRGKMKRSTRTQTYPARIKLLWKLSQRRSIQGQWFCP